MSMLYHKTTRRNIPEDLNLKHHRRENHKVEFIFFSFQVSSASTFSVSDIL
jgi:hypothetical protein